MSPWANKVRTKGEATERALLTAIVPAFAPLPVVWIIRSLVAKRPLTVAVVSTVAPANSALPSVISMLSGSISTVPPPVSTVPVNVRCLPETSTKPPVPTVRSPKASILPENTVSAAEFSRTSPPLDPDTSSRPAISTEPPSMVILPPLPSAALAITVLSTLTLPLAPAVKKTRPWTLVTPVAAIVPSVFPANA